MFTLIDPSRSLDEQLDEEEIRSGAALFSPPRTASPHIKKKKNLAALAACGMYVFFTGYLYCIHLAVDGAAKADPSPIEYNTPFHPQLKVYHPGESVKFSYTRSSKEADVPLLTLDTWTNKETGEVYPGPILGRVAKKGSEHVITFRQLPMKMSPGTYILEGWASAQMEKRVMPARYISEPFQVKQH